MYFSGFRLLALAVSITENMTALASAPSGVSQNNQFCEPNDGAIAAADAYSLVEIAKANYLDVLKYLNYVFKRIPIVDGNLTDDFLESIMPWNDAFRQECQRGYI